MSEGTIRGDGLAYEFDDAREAGTLDAVALATDPTPGRRRAKVKATRFFPRPLAELPAIDRAMAAALRARSLCADVRDTDAAFEVVRGALLDDAEAEARTLLAAIREARGDL